jgi:hypothetical protein
MSPPTAVRPSRPQQAGSLLRRIRPFEMVIAALIVAMIVPLSRIAFQPHFIGRISFENPTVYDVRVEVGDAGRAGWMVVTTARRKSTTVAQEVYDIGDVWVLRFAEQGKGGGEVGVTRAQLAGDGWNVVIPEQVGAQLRANGAPDPP